MASKVECRDVDGSSGRRRLDTRRIGRGTNRRFGWSWGDL